MSFSRNAQTKFVTTVTHPIPKRHVKNPSSTSQLLGMPSRRRRTRWQNERQLFQLPTPAALRRRVSSTPQSAQRLTAKRHARHGLPHSWRSRFQKGRKVVKVYGLRFFVRLLRFFGLLVEIYRLVPFSCHRGNGVSDVTATACVWGTVTPARTRARASVAPADADGLQPQSGPARRLWNGPEGEDNFISRSNPKGGEDNSSQKRR